MPFGIYLTPAELSARLKNKISTRTLANWRCQKIGPKFTKAGGRILYPVAEVESWERSRTVTGTADYARAS